MSVLIMFSICAAVYHYTVGIVKREAKRKDKPSDSRLYNRGD